MSDQKEPLGVFGAILVTLIILGLIALAANYLGWLPQY
jgi:hypothetical protein